MIDSQASNPGQLKVSWGQWMSTQNRASSAAGRAPQRRSEIPGDTTGPGVPPYRGYDAKAGEKIEVFWRNKWWPANVVKRNGPKTLVHYEGWSNNFDEWVTAERVRPRKL